MQNFSIYTHYNKIRKGLKGKKEAELQRKCGHFEDMIFLIRLQNVMSASYRITASKSYKHTGISFIVCQHLSHMYTHIHTNVQKDEDSRESGDPDYYVFIYMFLYFYFENNLALKKGVLLQNPRCKGNACQ